MNKIIKRISEKGIETGYTFYLNGTDYFIITDRVKITDRLCEIISQKLLHQKKLIAPSFLKNRMIRGCIEIRETKNHKLYYEIYGDTFAGRGDFVENETMVVIKLDH